MAHCLMPSTMPQDQVESGCPCRSFDTGTCCRTLRQVRASALLLATGPLKMFTLPSDYTYTKSDEVIKRFQDDALEAARPAPAAHPAHIVCKGSCPYEHNP